MFDDDKSSSLSEDESYNKLAETCGVISAIAGFIFGAIFCIYKFSSITAGIIGGAIFSIIGGVLGALLGPVIVVLLCIAFFVFLLYLASLLINS